MSLLVGAHTVAEQPNDSVGNLVALHFYLSLKQLFIPVHNTNVEYKFIV
jgi:hypothetical protein